MPFIRGVRFIIILFVLPAGVYDLPAQETARIGTLLTRTPEAGDYCIVGNPQHAGHDHLETVFLYRGRWVGVCPPHAEIISHPDSLAYHFAKLQPRGALYQEDAVQSDDRPIQPGWFYFGVWVAIALLSSALTTGIALRKGLPPVRWFFTGLVGSVFGVLYALFQPAKEDVQLPENLGKIPTTAAPAECPNCGSLNHPSAKQCVHCGAKLTPRMTSEVERV